MEEMRIERFPGEQDDAVTKYAWDRATDGASDDRYYDTEDEARRAARGSYGDPRIFEMRFERRYPDDPEDEDYDEFIEVEEVLLEDLSRRGWVD